jgi:5-formyltetrahydrofolate cyclo-ligase
MADRARKCAYSVAIEFDEKDGAMTVAMTQSQVIEAARREALARRDALMPEWRKAASESLAGFLPQLPIPADEPVVAGFFSIRSEIDPMPLMQAIVARGQMLCLPVVLADRETMIFRAWDGVSELGTSSFGLSVPPSTSPEIAPRVLLVPLAAFDAQGYRIGYGKGHYDRALARLEATGPVTKIGVAFSCQEIAEVPAEPHDRPLDYVLTEDGLLTCGMN